MKIYLYLEKEEWAEAWVNGGKIPITPASAYLADEREGVMTPDENLIHKSEVPIPSLRQFGFDIGGVRNLNMSGNRIIKNVNGIEEVTHVPDIKNGSYYKEDGLILSFCNHLSPATALKLGKVICVELTNIAKTKKQLDKRLGIRGEMKKCEYTEDHQRNHFLKHKDDAWQDEYRIFWKSQQGRRWVTIPSGTAKIVWTSNSKV
ncbi:hypothetical protein ACTXNE_12740 [Psychrobacter namhaensis]|uniref:hypothetical protein n=1 Tax=Psychrobacter namhaensis TaxID=292734 RepID=UPI003FCFF60C